MSSRALIFQKHTIELPKDLVHRALDASGQKLTATIRMGLELIAAKKVYKSLMAKRGKIDLRMNFKELRRD